jgi:cell wall-associated NlpC family hydrolase
MSFEGLAAVQARIAQIQQQFQPTAAASAGAPQSFAALLAAAGQGGLGSGLGADTGANGDPAALLATAGDPAAALAERAGALAGPGGTAGTGSAARTTFLQSALAQAGDPYIWGSSAPVSDTDPDAFDCSELVRWAAGRAGVDVPDGSWLQYLDLKAKGATIPVEQALRTPGALLFSFSSEPTPGGGRPSGAHVAISLGDGRTIEARGRKYGVGTWAAAGRFEYGAVIPGLT